MFLRKAILQWLSLRQCMFEISSLAQTSSIHSQMLPPRVQYYDTMKTRIVEQLSSKNYFIFVIILRSEGRWK